MAGLDGAAFRIALMHHPIDWMQEFDQEDLRDLLSRRFDLMLHAHDQRGGFRVLAVDGRRMRTLLSALTTYPYVFLRTFPPPVPSQRDGLNVAQVC